MMMIILEQMDSKQITIKVAAKVMIRRNIDSLGLINGTIAIVISVV